MRCTFVLHQKKQTYTLKQTLLTLRTETQTISKAVTSQAEKVSLLATHRGLVSSKSCQASPRSLGTKTESGKKNENMNKLDLANYSAFRV